MHGIPIVMKDNYDVAWMPTTGSSLALAGMRPPDNAFQVAALIEAGAVILGKTNLHELAAGITTISSLGGQTRNPYDPARNPGGSSGGTGAAVAASFAAVGWGTDTCGSIRIPAAVHNLFGLRPTKGLSSIDGILPLSHSQDTGGPLARTATDLAIALDATVGPDPADPATVILKGRTVPAFADALDPDVLDGARIGALEEWMSEGGAAGPVTRVLREALGDMEAMGARVVDVAIPSLDDLLSGTGLIGFEFKFDLIDYLAGVPGAPVGSLTEILDAGLHHEALDGTFRRRAAATDRGIARTGRDAGEARGAEGGGAGIHGPGGAGRARLPDHASGDGADRRGARRCHLLPERPHRAAGAHHPGGLHRERPAGGAGAAGASAGRRSPGRLRVCVRGRAPLGGGRPRGRRRWCGGGRRGSCRWSWRRRGGGEVAGAGADVEAVLGLDVPTATLSYRIEVAAGAGEEVHGMVVRRLGQDEGGPGAGVVVLTLGGPGEATLNGSVVLSTRLLHDLLEGRLELVVSTTDSVGRHELRAGGRQGVGIG